MKKVNTEILNAVAPCSMFCSTCTGCKYGDISLHAKELLRLLDGHKEFLEKNLKKEYSYKLEEFTIFQKKLKKYANPKCGGCRNGGASGCSIRGCFINECTKEHNVNFCGECNLFPCDKIDDKVFKESIIKKWLDGNTRIKQIGINLYYEERKNIPHYINHKKNR